MMPYEGVPDDLQPYVDEALFTDYTDHHNEQTIRALTIGIWVLAIIVSAAVLTLAIALGWS